MDVDADAKWFYNQKRFIYINSECIPDECFTDRWEIFLTTQLGLKYVSGTSSYSGVILGHLSLLPSDEIL